MKSPITGKEMDLVISNNELNFRKEVFKYVHKSYYCEVSDEYFTTTELDEFNLNQVYNLYRDKHNIPFPDELIEFRNKFKFSYADLSKILGLGVNSYKNYEQGEVPSLSNATLLKAVINSIGTLKGLIKTNSEITENQREKFLNSIKSIEKRSKENRGKETLISYFYGNNFLPDLYSGFKKPNFDKLSEMIVYFSKTLSPAVTKMNKLLFYADFLNYRQQGVSITGTRYFAHTHGPVPRSFRSVFEYLSEENKMTLVGINYGNGFHGEECRQHPSKDFNRNIFTDKELEVLQAVAEKFNSCNATSIRELSHEEDAWIENEANKGFIDYNYSFKLKHI